jgi:ABC-type sugar transport system ATPase subunit
VILVAHDFAHIFDGCDRVSLLENGAIIIRQAEARHFGG